MSAVPGTPSTGPSGELQLLQKQQLQPHPGSQDGPRLAAPLAGGAFVPALTRELRALSLPTSSSPGHSAAAASMGMRAPVLFTEGADAVQPRPPPASTGLDLAGLAASTSKSLQPKLLKQINSLTTKEEILNYIQHCHHLLDSINLVTCLYRLARIYSFTQSNDQKAAWKSELVSSGSFTVLLGVVHGHLTRAQAILTTQAEVPGLNARCLCNLVWSIAKLEVVGVEDGHPLALDVAMSSVPLVLAFIKDCSGQGLANLLWSFVKIAASPPEVIIAIVERMVELLEQPASSGILDAQALSNTIWAIAHIRSSPSTTLDNSVEWNNAVTCFLLLMANQCIALLTSAVEGGGHLHRQRAAQAAFEGGPGGQGSDSRFSCQAIVNIVWSFSAILGSACGVQEPVRPLFLVIRQLAIARLQMMLSGSAANQPLAQGLAGSFNEQALSNLVQAYDSAGLLNGELLQAVFDVAAIRLGRSTAGVQGPLGFKPAELCALLRASHLGLAQPWNFLHTLSRVMAQYPGITQGWSSAELSELHQALQLLHNAMPAPQPPLALHMQPVAAPLHLANLALAGASGSSGSSMGSYTRPRQQQVLAPAVVPAAPQVGGSAQLGLYMQQQQLVMPPSNTSALSMGSGSTVSTTSLQPSLMQHVLLPGAPPGGRPSSGAAPHAAAQHHRAQQFQHVMSPPSVPAVLHYQVAGGGAPLTGGSGAFAIHSPQPPVAHGPQDATQLSVLQQVWVVDTSGNLQPTMVLVPVQEQLQQLTLGGAAALPAGASLVAAPGNRSVDLQPPPP